MREQRRNHLREAGRLVRSKRFRQPGAHHLRRRLLGGLLKSLFGIGYGGRLSRSPRGAASHEISDRVGPAHGLYSGITNSWPGLILFGSESLSRLASKIFWYLLASP